MRAWQVLKAAVAADRERRAREPKRGRDERAFMPAAIEIMETPARPAGRAIVFLIVAFFAAGVLWATLGEVDIHATAQGRIVPAGRVKVIEPLETATVAAIHVRDGDRVKAGDMLIELDPTEASADKDRLWQELMAARTELARLEAQILAVEANLEPVDAAYEPPAEADASFREGQRQLLISAVVHLRAELAAIDGQIGQRRAERNSARKRHERQSAMVATIGEMLQQRRELLDRGSGSRTGYLETAQRLHEEEGNLAQAEGTWRQAEAAIVALERQAAERRAAFLAEAIGQREEARTQTTSLAEELKKAVRRDERTDLTTPVDGTVLQLAVHTVGSVVTSGEQLMIVVPDDAGLEVEAMVLNRDKGFVVAGDPAEIKLEAFPFTKYGTIPGAVQLVSNDSVEDETFGLVFPARISLAREVINADGKDVRLSPGMSVTAEVKTGQRRVIEYLMAPLLRYRDEAIRER